MGESQKGGEPRGRSVSRRGLLKGGAVVVGSAVVTASTLGRAFEASKAEGAHFPVEPVEFKYLEAFPGVRFIPLTLDGNPVGSSLEPEQPTGFWFHAPNGVRLRMEIVQAVDRPRASILSELYDSQGNRVGIPGDRIVESTVHESGDYFWVLTTNRGVPLPNDRSISARVENALEHGIHATFLRRSSGEFHIEVRSQPEAPPPVFPESDIAVIIDFNNKGVFDGQGNLRAEINVFAQQGGPGELQNDTASYPEYSPTNQVPIKVERVDDKRVKVSSASGRWPEGYHIAVRVTPPPDVLDEGSDVKARFFTAKPIENNLTI